jgi:tetratricopeptide (TPR) repeat protein
LEKSWMVSNKRYARAKRLLGSSAFKRGDYEAAKTHLMEALEVNSQFSWAWFRLGAAAMRTGDWSKARMAYSRVVAMEPSDGDSWANLSTSLVQLGDYEAAFSAIGEAAKHANLNWKIWDSFLTLAITLENVNGAIQALDTLLDLGERRADSGGKVVDPRALLSIVDMLLKLDAQEPFTERARARFTGVVDKIKSKTTSNADVWAVLAHYYGKLNDRRAERDVLFRRCRALMTRGVVAGGGGSSQWSSHFDTVKAICLTCNVLINGILQFGDGTNNKSTIDEIHAFVSMVVEHIELSVAEKKLIEVPQPQFQDMVEMVKKLRMIMV